jgi:Glycosyltransferases involved in cell wall biogenesis
MTTPFFSFIVPVYNVEKYIFDCLNSIVKQDFKDYEVIIVDDGSIDSSKQICAKFLKDKRFHYFYKKNGGLSDARNFGINKSHGEYLVFIDSDDFYVKPFLMDLRNTIEKNKTNIVLINSFKYFDSYNSKKTERKIKISERKKEQFKACAWDKIINRKFLLKNNLFFPFGLLSEDILWCGNLILSNASISFYNHAIYAYRQRPNSITKKISQKHVSDIFSMIEELRYKSNNNKSLYIFLSFEYACLIYTISSLKKNERDCFRLRYKENDDLLKYSKRTKNKFVLIVYSIFGYNFTCLFLNIFQKVRSLF